MGLAMVHKPWYFPCMTTKLRNTWATFTAGEAEKITGLSPDTQRDWRRRGFLDAPEKGWSRYELRDLAELLVMSALQERGIGPSISKNIAGVVALRLSFFVVSWVEAIDDRTNGEMEKIIQQRRKLVGETRGHFFITPSTEPRRFVIFWANGTTEFVEDIGKAFSELSSDPRYHGAILVLDLEALATLLIERAGRPFVSVELR